MKEIAWKLFELLVTLFESAVSMRFVCSFLDEGMSKKEFQKLWIGLILCHGITVTVMNTLAAYEGLLVISYVIVVFLYSIFFFQSKLLKKLFVSVFYICCIIINSSLGVNIISSILNVETGSVYTEQNLTRFITLIFVQLLNLTVFQILTKLFCKGGLILSKREWCLLASTFLISIIGLSLIQIALTHSDATQTARICLLGVDITIITVDYIMIHLITVLNHHHQDELKNQKIQAQLQYQTQYAESVRQQEETVHKLRHDLKSTISALYGFIRDNNVPDMEKYLGNYTTQLAETASIVHTNQPFLNAILNTKLTYAKENGILCTYHSPANLPDISGADYCSLFGNLLDNAIEAEMIEDIAKPEIHISIEFEADQLIIAVKNKINKSVLETNTNLHTTKTNSNHGYGIPTIKSVIKHYDGTLDFYERNDFFIVRIILHI